MNGYELCKKVKTDVQLCHIPVILLTALRSQEDRVRGIEAGADDFISKPFQETDFLARKLKIKF